MPSKPDAQPDAPFPCGTMVCDTDKVCCLKKVPPSANCIDPKDYVSQGCETIDLSCFSPHDCPSGLVCCVVLKPTPAFACRQETDCPGDGVNNIRICDTPADCAQVDMSCVPVNTGGDAGTTTSGVPPFNICQSSTTPGTGGTTGISGAMGGP